MKKTFICILLMGSFCVAFGQKITIEFDAIPSTPPSIAKAVLKYNKDFAYSFTFDDATSDAMTTAAPLFKGGFIAGVGQTFSGLFYTDGCGNDIPFRGGIGWNSANLAGNDVHLGTVSGQLTWAQLDTLYDLGWDVMNHSYTHRSALNGAMSGTDYVNQIEQNRVAVEAKTQKHLEMPIFVVPSGDTFYNSIAYRQGNQLVFNQPGESIGFGGLAINTDVNFDNKVVHRMLLEESLAITPTFLERAAAKVTGDTKIWYNEFTHRVDDYTTAPSSTLRFMDFQGQLKHAADTWGKTGTDRMWMAPLQEVYEYLLMRKNAKYTSSSSANKMDLTFDLTDIPSWLRRRTLSLVVNSSIDFSNVVVPAGVKVTFKGTGNQKLINLDFTNFVITAASEPRINPSVLKVYPNPTNDVLSVETPFNDDALAQITVYDVAGKTVLTEKMKGKTIQLNTSKLNSGHYFILVKKGTEYYRSSFVKEKNH